KSIFKTIIDGKTTWIVPFSGSDKFVIIFQYYLQLPSFNSVVKLIFFGLSFSLFIKFKLDIHCLLKYLGLFSAGLFERPSFKMTCVTHTEDNILMYQKCQLPVQVYIT
ncbi:unnamed protein product, partial [Rotaria sp. Silwood2]